MRAPKLGNALHEPADKRVPLADAPPTECRLRMLNENACRLKRLDLQRMEVAAPRFLGSPREAGRSSRLEQPRVVVRALNAARSVIGLSAAERLGRF